MLKYTHLLTLNSCFRYSMYPSRQGGGRGVESIIGLFQEKFNT